MEKRLRIALLIESSRAYGRGLLAGIAAYVRDHGDWSVFHQERGMSDDAPRWFARWRGDGVIARIESPKLRDQLANCGLPVIDLRGMYDIAGLPLIETNDQQVTRRAFEHLRERGYRQLAYCGFAGANFSQRRLRYFRELANQADCSALYYEGGHHLATDTASIEGENLAYEAGIVDWIAALPRPIGVMACNDVRGQQFVNACRELEIAVPEEIAVIGVDNDELICQLCDPPLTSVAPDTRRIGYAAAEMMDAMIRDGLHPPTKTFIDPLRIDLRASTGSVAIADPQIARAMRFIRLHACDGIQVSDVVQAIGMSRSSLERRFIELLGHAPKREIDTVQLRRVKELLHNTDFTLDRIAAMTGFAHVETMCRKFRRETAMTPGEFRAQS